MWSALTALIISGSSAFAIDSNPIIEGKFQFSQWRPGLALDTKTGAKFSMLEEEGNPLREGTGLSTTADIRVNPAYVKGGATAVFSPLAILDVRAGAGYIQYFGNFQTIIGYPTADTNYGTNEELAAYVADTQNQGPGGGWYALGGLTLKAKAGPIVVLLDGAINHWNIESDVEGDWFFEREQEVMLQFGGDQVLSLNGVLLYELDNNPDDERFLRVGNLTSRQASFGGEDTLLRSGLLVVWNRSAHFSHTFLVQPYVVSRAQPTVPPMTAYVLKYTY